MFSSFRSWWQLTLLAATCLMLAIMPGCGEGSGTGEELSSESEDLTNCSSSSSAVFLEVKDAEGLEIYANTGLTRYLLTLEPGTTVRREDVRELVKDHPVTFVTVRTGPHKDRMGWVHSADLQLRAPNPELACANGVNPEGNASAYERMQVHAGWSPLLPSDIRRVSSCATGLGEGAIAASETLKNDVEALVRGAWAAIKYLNETVQLYSLLRAGSTESSCASAARPRPARQSRC